MEGGFFWKNMTEKDQTKDQGLDTSDSNQFALMVAKQLAATKQEIKKETKDTGKAERERTQWLNKREKYLNELAEQIQSMLGIIEQQFSLKNYGINKRSGANINLNLKENSYHKIFEFDYCEVDIYWKIGDTIERQIFLVLTMVSEDHNEPIKYHLFYPKTNYNESGVALCQNIYNEAEINGWGKHIEWHGDLNADNEGSKHKDDISNFILDTLGPKLKENLKNTQKS